ncbi:MAG: C2 family cysteine protease [Brachybacterium sp.]|uniref:C2 family cysteine protease n=1 Tax=Brachybacterium sp. TaxID=1891286 RepID=UPI002648F7A4|nr:C2 family cysteine protease [Brachybacterium sp.]MDN5688141.1 C2 family cysteine protease [Brachybacterium sp.]
MTAERQPRVRTWRRSLRALAPSGRARAASVGAEASDGAEMDAPVRVLSSPGPAATGWRLDAGPLTPPRPLRPRQGRVGDCWVIAPMLAIHETDPRRLPSLLSAEDDGTVTVRLPAVDAPIRVDRQMPVAASGTFVAARRDGANPGWVGVLEKAVAAHVAGGYTALQRGVARFGLELLLGLRVRTLLRLPSAAQILAWRQEGRAITASTHPLSSLLPTTHGPLPRSHVYAVVGADAVSGHVRLRDPTRPERVLVVDARTFGRGFLSVDVTPPLR